MPFEPLIRVWLRHVTLYRRGASCLLSVSSESLEHGPVHFACALADMQSNL